MPLMDIEDGTDLLLNYEDEASTSNAHQRLSEVYKPNTKNYNFGVGRYIKGSLTREDSDPIKTKNFESRLKRLEILYKLLQYTIFLEGGLKVSNLGFYLSDVIGRSGISMLEGPSNIRTASILTVLGLGYTSLWCHIVLKK